MRARIVGVTGLAALLLFLGFGVAGSLSVKMERVRIESRDLPEAGSPLMLLQISDLHSREGLRMNRRVASLVASATAGLMVITGDFKQAGGSEDVAVEGGALIADAVAGRFPIYAVRGNNDTKKIMKRLAGRGIRVLDNESAQISPGVWLSGWNPYSPGNPSLAAVLADIPERDYVILLSHSPDVILEEGSSRAQLVLSGHTHGGQIRLPGFRPLITLTRVGSKYYEGLYPRENGYLYINRGLGTTMIPLRLFAAPEITLLTIVPASAVRQIPLN